MVIYMIYDKIFPFNRSHEIKALLYNVKNNIYLNAQLS
jgi:hypothetical protein